MDADDIDVSEDITREATLLVYEMEQITSLVERASRCILILEELLQKAQQMEATA